MPPRRSARLNRSKAKAAVTVTVTSEVDRFYTREKKRREICHKRLPSADRNLQLAMSGIWSDDSKLQLDSTTKLLNLVSVEDNPLIDEVVQLGAVPRLVEFLKGDDYPQLQFEAIRVLKNIAAENTQVVIDSGAVPVFVKLLESSSDDLQTCEQVAWSLGNIAGESFRCRDVVVKCEALRPLLTLFEKHNSLSFLRVGTWTLTNILEKAPKLTNIFDKAPKVPYEQEELEFAIRTFESLLVSKDEEVLKEACWGLLYLSCHKYGIGTIMYEAELCFKLAYLFDHAPLIVLFPALRAITSIMDGAANLDKSILDVRRRVLQCTERAKRKDVFDYFQKDRRCLKRFFHEVHGFENSVERVSQQWWRAGAGGVNR